MIITYRDREIDASPAAIKEYVKQLEDDEEVGVPWDGEACLVNRYLSVKLHEQGLAPIVFVNSTRILIGEDPDGVEIYPDVALARLIEAFDEAPTDEWGYTNRDQVLDSLSSKGVW